MTQKRAEEQSEAEAPAQVWERKFPQSTSIWKWCKGTHATAAEEVSAHASVLNNEESWREEEGAACGTSVMDESWE